MKQLFIDWLKDYKCHRKYYNIIKDENLDNYNPRYFILLALARDFSIYWIIKAYQWHKYYKEYDVDAYIRKNYHNPKVIEFETFLRDNGIYDLYCKRCKCCSWDKLFNEKTNHLISAVFYWNNTDEGVDFWANINKKWIDALNNSEY